MLIQLTSIGDGGTVSLPVSQLVVFNDQGTPIMVAGEYGPPGSIKVAHAADPDFKQVLRAFGYGRHQIETTNLSLPEPPSGAKLLKVV
jgi:hypothetical protein